MKKISLSFVLLGYLALNQSIAAEAANTTKDCAGRLRFNLPGEAEVASVPYKTLMSQISSFDENFSFGFPDGESAEFSKVLVFGTIAVSDGLSETQIGQAIKKFNDEKVNRIAKRRLDLPISTVQGDAKSPSGRFFAWSIGNEVRVLLRLSNRVLSLGIDESDLLSKNASNAMMLVEKTQSRADFSVPSKSGICFPGSFVDSSDLTIFGKISSVYKLKANPNITIAVSDAVPRMQENEAQEKGQSPKSKINRFWGQKELTADVMKIEAAFPEKNGKTVKMAGQQGLASYVKITRKDGQIDYGYYSVSHGNPNNPETADIGIYILTHSAFAKSNSAFAVDASTFLKIAKSVEESVSFMGR